MSIYSDTVFSGFSYFPVFTDGNARPLPAYVPTIYAVRPDRTEVVACANLASARAIAEGRAPCLVATQREATLSVTAYRSPSGQYYVTVELQGSVSEAITTVRIDCANQATARHYYRNGVPTFLVTEELLNQ